MPSFANFRQNAKTIGGTMNSNKNNGERKQRTQYLGHLIRENVVSLTGQFAAHFKSNERDAIEQCIHSVADQLEKSEGETLSAAKASTRKPELECRTSRFIEVTGKIRLKVVELLKELVDGLTVEDIMLVLAAIDQSAIALCWSPDQTSDRPKRKLRLLLAEDTRATRELLLSAFDSEKYAIDVAFNGQDAYEQFQKSSYDVVLTDVQMPVLDGLTATRRMRALESEQPKRGRTPIIAITAGASEADQEACLRAGMDAFFPKPIDLPRLFDTIMKIVERSENKSWEVSTDVAGRKKEKRGDNHKSFDLKSALRRLQGDRSMFMALADFFVDDHLDLLNQIRTGARESDPAGIRRGVHALKGMASGLSANKVVACASRIESIIRSDPLQSVDAEILELEKEIALLVDELDRYIADASR